MTVAAAKGRAMAAPPVAGPSRASFLKPIMPRPFFHDARALSLSMLPILPNIPPKTPGGAHATRGD